MSVFLAIVGTAFALALHDLRQTQMVLDASARTQQFDDIRRASRDEILASVRQGQAA